MAENIGNVGLSLKINSDEVDKALREIQDGLERTKKSFAEAFGSTAPSNPFDSMSKSLLGTNSTSVKLKGAMEAIRKEWSSLDFGSKKKSDIDYINKRSGELLNSYIKIKELIDKTSISIDEYAKRAAKASTVGSAQAKNILAATEGASSISQRKEALRQLIETRDKLNSSDKNYSQTLAALNSRILNYSDANKKAISTGVELRKQTVKFGEAAEWASRKVAFYGSLYTLQRMATKLVEIRGEFELQQKSLAAIIQNKYEADKIFNQIVDLSLKSPFKLKELITYTKELSAYRIETEKLFSTTKMLADVSAGLGVDMGRLILAYGQVRSASVLRGQELRQFTEAGIPLVAELAKQFSILYGRVVKSGEVFDLIRNRMVSFEMVDKIFKDMTSSGGIFYEMQKKQADTLKGKVMNLSDAIEIMFNKIGEGSEEFLKGIVDTVTNLVRNYDLLLNNLALGIAILGRYKAVTALTNITILKFNDVIIKGTGILRTFANKGISYSMLVQKEYNTVTGFTSKALLSLQKAAILANVAMQSLKAAFMSFLPAAVIMALFELFFYLSNISKKNKEFREGLDKTMTTTMMTTDQINTQINAISNLSAELKRANLSSEERSKIESKRAGIIAEVARTEGELADRIADNVNNQEELNRVQKEFNSLKQYELLVTRFIQDSGGSNDNITALLTKQSELELEKTMLLGKQREILTSSYGYAQAILQSEKNSGKELSSMEKKLLVILSSSNDILEKRKKIHELLRKEGSENNSTARLFDKYRNKLSDLNFDIDKNSEKLKKVNGEIGKQMNALAEDTKNYFVGAYGDTATYSKTQIAGIQKVLDKTFPEGKQYTVNIIGLLKLREEKPISSTTNEVKGWADNIKSIIGKASSDAIEIVDKENQTLSGALSEIAGERDNLLKNYNVYLLNKKKLSKTDILMMEDLDKKIKAHNAVLKYYGWESLQESKAKADPIIEREKNRIDVVEQAMALYDQYSEKLGKTVDTKKMVLNVFSKEFQKYGINADDIFSKETKSTLISEYGKTIDILEKNRQKKNAETTDDLVRNLTKKIGENEFKIRLSTNESSLDAIQKRIDTVLARYEATKELGQYGSLANALLPNPADISDVIDTINTEIARLDSMDGEEALKRRKELEDKREELILSKRKDTISKISELEKEMMTNLDKTNALSAQITEDEAQLAHINGLGRKLTLDEEYEAKRLNLTIKYNKMQLFELSNQTLKETAFYERLFSDLSMLSTRSLKKIVEEGRNLLNTAKSIGNNKMEISVIGDNGEITRREISIENYLSLVKQVTEAEKRLASIDPFTASIKGIKKYIQSDKELKRAKEEVTKAENELRIAESLGDPQLILDAQQKLNAAKKTEGEIQAKNDDAKKNALEKISQSISDVNSVVSSISSLADALGANEQTIAIISGIQDGLSGVQSIAAAIASGNPVQMISGILNGVTSLINGIKKIHDAKYQQIIDFEKERIEYLQRAYNDLEKAKNKAFDLSEQSKSVQEQQNIINSQINALQKMSKAEQDKKDTDTSAIKDYNNQIQDLIQQSQELEEQWLDELRGIDTKSAAEQFASAWIDAALEGENALDSFSDKFDEMIKEMIVTQAASRIIGNIIDPLFDQLDAAFGMDGVLTTDELSNIMGQFPDIMEQMNSAMNAIIKPMLEAAGLTSSTVSSSGSLQADIQSIQEETAGKLVSLINSMRSEMYRHSELFESMDLHLFAINSSTADSLTELRAMRAMMVEIRDWQKSITFAGHPRGGSGIKMFGD